MVPADTLTPAAPGPTPPKVFSNKAIEHGTTAATLWDAHWAMSAHGATYGLSGATVTAHVFLTTPGGPVKVSLYDAGVGDYVDVNTPFASQTVTVPAAAAPTDVVVTFTGVTATLTRGFELYVDNYGTGDAEAYYDSVLTPTRVEVS